MDKLYSLYRISIAFSAIWTSLITYSTMKDISFEKEKAITLAKREAVTTFNKDQAFRLWSTEHGGVYVPISAKTMPNKFLSHIPERDITTDSGRHLTLMNPAYMVRQIMEDYEKVYGIKGHITSLHPLNPLNYPDAWERASLEKFEKGHLDDISEIEQRGDSYYMRLMGPMQTQEGCLKCHGFQGYKVGDIRGGVSVQISMAPYLAAESAAVNHTVITHLFFWFAGTAAILFFTLWGRKRVKAEIIHNEKLHGTNIKLKKALDEVKTLRGIIPICVYCKKIRDDKGLWSQVEEYIKYHSEAEFSHGACPECYEKLMKELE